MIFMINFTNHIKCFALISSVLLVTSCGGGGGSSTSGCDTPLTVDYVNNEFLTNDQFYVGQFVASGTTLIHEDGDQGNAFDIDRIILSRITHPSGNTLALSVSTYATSYTPSDANMVFYIDVDKDAATGQLIDGIGADLLILDNLPIGSGFTSLATARVQIWDSVSGSWLGAPTLGILSATASYHAGCTLGLSIYVPLSEGLDTLYTMPVRGVLKLIRLTNGDPNTPVAVPAVDSTSVFDFVVP